MALLTGIQPGGPYRRPAPMPEKSGLAEVEDWIRFYKQIRDTALHGSNSTDNRAMVKQADEKLRQLEVQRKELEQ